MSQADSLIDKAVDIAGDAANLSDKAVSLSQDMLNFNCVDQTTIINGGVDYFVFSLTIFVLACFIGYFVVWKVTPALHTPLMSITNAISSIIVIGALIAASTTLSPLTGSLGLVAVFIASINIFGGFLVTIRMLQMFQNKKVKK